MKIHWFAFTVHASEEYGRGLWKEFLLHPLGILADTDRKGRGFENISVALNEAKFYYNPIQSKKENEPIKQYFHFELPGSACDAVTPDTFQSLYLHLKASGYRFAIKRLDLAFDDCPFSPVEFMKMLMLEDCAVTLAKRETFSITQTPFKRRDNFYMGCETTYVGDATSQRYIRVYNKRGATRLEMVCKDERADVVCADLFQYAYPDWDRIGRGHVVQYIRFDDRFVQWQEFVNGAVSADIKISSARVVSLSRMEGWFERQVSVALSVYYEVWGHREADKKLKHIISKAERRDRSRYASVLQLSNAGGCL
jgi:hypothetical protein